MGGRRVDVAPRDVHPRYREPMSVYEVHFASWRPGLSYRDAADQLIDYVAGQGFTHIEFLPARRASLRRIVGLPGDGLLRPDEPLRSARMTSGT